MVPAHRQETQASLDAAGQTGGFAKVLTSIQGLQQRLDGFSLDEANQAEANVLTGIKQLMLLQSKLTRIAELKQFVFASNSRISEIPEQNFEQVDLDSLENHPQLHAIIQASKLIQIYKLMKAAKAEADSVSFDSEVGRLEFTIPPQSVVEPVSVPNEELAAMVASATATPTKNESPDGTAVALDPQPRETQEKAWVFSGDAELENGDPQFIERSIPAMHGAEHRSAGATLVKSADAKKRSSSDATFDQRLLSDLIEAYGEFSPRSKPPAQTQPIIARLDSAEAEKHFTPKLSRFDPIEISVEAETARQNPAERLPQSVHSVASNSANLNLPALHEVKLPVAAEATDRVAFTPPAGDISLVPKAVSAQSKPVQENARVPNVTKNGELDRQLKSIIKDYGEYDLYSRQSSTNIKKAAIVAFALLGLVLGGFYFFKASAPAVNSSAPAVSPSPPGSDTIDSRGEFHGESEPKARSETK